MLMILVIFIELLAGSHIFLCISFKESVMSVFCVKFPYSLSHL